jgi:hypothetical protein
MDELSEELTARVNSELQQGERLVWLGQPRPGRLMWSSIPVVLFGIPWTAFSLFWMGAASGVLFEGGTHEGPPGFGAFFICFPLFGLPFVLIGLGMLSSPYWVYRQARRTCYALTNQRALIWTPKWNRSVEVRSFKAAELGKIVRRDYADGNGDLVFEEVVSTSRDSDGDLRTTKTEHGFIGIENVRDVEDKLRKALLGGK